MKARLLVDLTTSTGTIPAGQVVNIPDHLSDRLFGKVELVSSALPETIQTTHGPVAYKDIESVFSIDTLWTRFRGDPHWLKHLAETLLRWREAERRTGGHHG